MATRTLIIDLSKGTGGEPMYGMVTVQRTRATSKGTFEVLPWETKLKLFNGIATITEAVTDGPGPFYDSAYLIRVQNGYCAPRWGFMTALPDGTTPISTGDMPKVNPITGEGIYMDAQEWNALYGTLPDRVTSLENSQTVQDERLDSLEVLGGISPGDVSDATVKSLIINPESETSTALSAASVFAVADPANQTVFVTPRGNDGNNGLTPKTAKLTLAGGIAALGGVAGTIQLGYGTTTVTGPLPGLPSGTLIQGGGRNSGASLISFTGTGTLFKGTPGTRSYNHQFRDILVNGPGKTSDTVAFDLEDMSQARFDGVTISLVGLGIHHRSQTLGGAVYNTFIDMLINSCGTGVRFDPAGSNGSRWYGVKFGANNIAVDILDSNQNSFLACQFEVNSTAIRVNATLPGTSDNNIFYGCRFETNTVAWNIVSPNVRDMVIDWPAFFGAVGTPIDNGTRTRINSTHPSLTPPGGQRNVIVRGGSYTVGPGDEIILMAAHGTTATLPAANTVKPGRAYAVKNIVIGPSASVTVASAGGTIDGVETVPLSTMASISLVSNGVNWFSI